MFLTKIMEYLYVTSNLLMYNCFLDLNYTYYQLWHITCIHFFSNHFSVSKLKSQSRKGENYNLKNILEILVHMENLWSWKGSADITKSSTEHGVWNKLGVFLMLLVKCAQFLSNEGKAPSK